MASISAPRLLLRQRLSFRCRVSALSQHFIRHSHQGNGERSAGVAGFESQTPGTVVPFNIWEKEIYLWHLDRKYGPMSMEKVKNDFLRPGTTLSWRVGDEVLRRLDPGHSRDDPDADILHYDVIRIPIKKTQLVSPHLQKLQMKRKFEVFIRSNAQIANDLGHRLLSYAYHVLSDPYLGARYPVEVHIAPPSDPGSPFGVKWASRNRIDLHPEVIMRAMPYHVRYTRELVGDKAVGWRKSGFFTLTAKSYNPALRFPSNNHNGDPDQAAAASEPNPSAVDKQMKFEHALNKSLRAAKHNINKALGRKLKRTFKNRVRNGQRGPLPEELSRFEDEKKAKIKEASAKIQAHFERMFEVNSSPADAAEPEPFEGSKGGPSSPTTDDKSR